MDERMKSMKQNFLFSNQLLQKILNISEESLEELVSYIKSIEIPQEDLLLNISIVSEIRYKTIDLLVNLLKLINSNFKNGLDYDFLMNQLQQRKVYYFLLQLLQNNLITIKKIWERAPYDKDLSTYFRDELKEFDPFFFRNHSKTLSTIVVKPKKGGPNQPKINVRIFGSVEPEERTLRMNKEPIAAAIREDNVSLMEKIITDSKLKFTEFIRLKINEMFIGTVTDKNPTLIEYAAFYGSFKCFKFLVKKLEYLPKHLILFAIAGGNVDMVQLCLKNKISFDDSLETSIKYHQYDIMNLLQKNHRQKLNFSCLNNCIVYNNFEAFKLYMKKYKSFDINKIKGSYVLKNAIRFSAINYLKVLIPEDFEINSTDKSKVTLAHVAAECGAHESIVFLSSFDYINFNAKDKYGETPLHLASKNGHLTTTIVLCSYEGSYVNARSNNGETPLHNAVKNGQLEIIQFLCSFPETNINITDVDGNTLLHVASKTGYKEVIEFLVSLKGIDVNQANKKGLTPLLIAIGRENFDIVEFLISLEETDINFKTQNNQNLLHLVAKNCPLDIFKSVLKRGNFDINETDNEGRTALHFAALGNNLEVVHYILSLKGTKFNPKDSKGRTPFLSSVLKGSCDVAQFLCNYEGIDIIEKTNDGRNALHCALQSANNAMVKLILSLNMFDINVIDNDGWTPLHIAALSGNIKNVKLLLSTYGINVEAQNNKGETAYDIAQKGRNEKLMNLIESGPQEPVDEN